MSSGAGAAGRASGIEVRVPLSGLAILGFRTSTPGNVEGAATGVFGAGFARGGFDLGPDAGTLTAGGAAATTGAGVFVAGSAGAFGGGATAGGFDFGADAGALTAGGAGAGGLAAGARGSMIEVRGSRTSIFGAAGAAGEVVTGGDVGFATGGGELTGAGAGFAAAGGGTTGAGGGLGPGSRVLPAGGVEYLGNDHPPLT